MLLFFFSSRRRHTRCLSDWSSDVCSSDLGWRVEKAEELEGAVREWLAAPGPALLDVLTDRMELVMPPHVEASQVFGMALYSAKAVLGGRAGEVVDLLEKNYRP